MTVRPLAHVFRGTPRNLSRLARELKRGELVAVPTETVYGLAANAFDARACQKIFRAKGRPTSDPLIVHLHSLAQLDEIAVVNDSATKLAREFWPGALTIVLPKRTAIPDIVSAGLPSVAVRMPAHPLFRQLLKKAGLPLAAPSANPFGYVSPTTAEHVRANLGTKIRNILDGGPSSIGVESTIIDLRDEKHPRLLRPGAITRTQLENALGVRVAGVKKKTGASRAQVAPGLLARHYSPRTPSVLHTRIVPEEVRHSTDDEAWIFIARPHEVSGRNVFWFDARGNLAGVARNLFSRLREVDAVGFRRIHLERASGEGLADAINDRLQRAAAKSH